MEEAKRTGGGMPTSAKALLSRFAEYLDAQEGELSFPNVAGFCRYCGYGEEWFGELKRKFPSACDFILTALEDEALNVDRSPTLVTAYLKHRLGYGETASGGPEVVWVDRSLAADGE